MRMRMRTVEEAGAPRSRYMGEDRAVRQSMGQGPGYRSPPPKGATGQGRGEGPALTDKRTGFQIQFHGA